LREFQLGQAEVRALPQSSDMSRGLSPTRLIARFAVRIALLVAFAAFGSVGFARSLSALL